MRFYVGVTDNNWFYFLAARKPDELNFWRPGGTMAFRALSVGEPFLFKLHSPLNYIVGGGFFVSFSRLPLSIAWETFGEKNGATDFAAFRKQIIKYRERGQQPVERDPTIGCIVLASPFFFSQNEWIPVPADWNQNLVQGKTYSTLETAGAKLWEQVEQRLQGQPVVEAEYVNDNRVTEQPARYGDPYLIRPRLGQGAFRVLVTDAYSRRCAMTGERTLPVLDAAHIKPFSESGPHLVSNGLLLRSDLHILFDRGYLTVTDSLHIEVSKRIKEEYENGREYYALHGKSLVTLPLRPIDRPSLEFLQWHQQEKFVP
jgi:putative restriction endonuclease